MKKIASSVVSLCLIVGIMQAAHWGYEEHNGPKKWAELDPKFALCSKGMQQSSVNIQTSKTIESKNEIQILHGTNATDILNNGHTMAVHFKEAGGVVYKGRKYTLLQLHFHTPSETQIDGKDYPLEMHLVHKDSEDNYLVVAVLFRKGQNNPALNTILSHAPMDINKKHSINMFYIADLLPQKHGYYAFDGSLTTPPCNEGVQWIVLKDSMEASQAQIDAMHAILQDNARDVQPLHNRKILSAP